MGESTDAGQPVVLERVVFDKRSHKLWEQLATAVGISKGEVIQEALSLYWWIALERRRGNKILVERDSIVVELVMPNFDEIGPLPELEDYE